MFKIILLFFMMTLAKSELKAQSCTHSNLSYNFDFKITGTKIIDKDSVQRTVNVSVTIYSKNKLKLIQEIHFVAYCPFASAYKNCFNDRSFITGKNKNIESTDNDFGDIVIADFDFDGKEDFALKKDSGGNSGPLYDFYLQYNNTFKIDTFLSEKVEFFPVNINIKNKTLTTNVHANIYGYYEKTYKCNIKNKKWQLFKQRFIKV